MRYKIKNKDETIFINTDDFTIIIDTIFNNNRWYRFFRSAHSIFDLNVTDDFETFFFKKLREKPYYNKYYSPAIIFKRYKEEYSLWFKTEQERDKELNKIINNK